MAIFTNASKSASPTFKTILRKGTDPRIVDIENLTFTDQPFLDGTELKDLTFDQLANQVYVNQSKSSAPTFNNETRN